MKDSEQLHHFIFITTITHVIYQHETRFFTNYTKINVDELLTFYYVNLTDSQSFEMEDDAQRDQHGAQNRYVIGKIYCTTNLIVCLISDKEYN